jgi:phosphatidylserine decarboxylase
MSGGKNRRKAALIGGAVGLVAGVLVGAATSGDCTGDCNDPYGVGGDGLTEAVATGTGVVIGGAVFGGLGALVGGLFFAPERWVRVEFPGLR